MWSIHLSTVLGAGLYVTLIEAAHAKRYNDAKSVQLRKLSTRRNVHKSLRTFKVLESAPLVKLARVATPTLEKKSCNTFCQ